MNNTTDTSVNGSEFAENLTRFLENELNEIGAATFTETFSTIAVEDLNPAVLLSQMEYSTGNPLIELSFNSDDDDPLIRYSVGDLSDKNDVTFELCSSDRESFSSEHDPDLESDSDDNAANSKRRKLLARNCSDICDARKNSAIGASANSMIPQLNESCAGLSGKTISSKDTRKTYSKVKGSSNDMVQNLLLRQEKNERNSDINNVSNKKKNAKRRQTKTKETTKTSCLAQTERPIKYTCTKPGYTQLGVGALIWRKGAETALLSDSSEFPTRSSTADQVSKPDESEDQLPSTTCEYNLDPI